MKKRIESSPSLIKAFTSATKRAFQCYPELYTREVSDHIFENVLMEFVRTENLYCIKNCEGKRVDQVPDMLIEGDTMHNAQSLERELMVQEHIGDFSLFMAGALPYRGQKSKASPWRMRKGPQDRLFMQMFIRLYPAKRGMDFYVIQGMGAYERAARIYRGLNDAKSLLLKRLSRHFEAYATLVRTIHEFLLTQGCTPG